MIKCIKYFAVIFLLTTSSSYSSRESKYLSPIEQRRAIELRLDDAERDIIEINRILDNRYSKYEIKN